jgi:hypothetical protein
MGARRSIGIIQKELFMLKQNIIPVLVVEHLDTFHTEASTMPVNLYRTDDYLVINAGLPRCLADKVHVFVILKFN